MAVDCAAPVPVDHGAGDNLDVVGEGFDDDFDTTSTAYSPYSEDSVFWDDASLEPADKMPKGPPLLTSGCTDAASSDAARCDVERHFALSVVTGACEPLCALNAAAPDAGSSHQLLSKTFTPEHAGQTLSGSVLRNSGSASRTTTAKRAPQRQPEGSGRPAASRRHWTPEEEERFLTALDRFGPKEAKNSTGYGRVSVRLGPGVAEMISIVVGTRSVAQVRSHVQKHYIRKEREAARRIPM